MRAELGALEASAERAGAALACVYSSSDEFEAAQIASTGQGASRSAVVISWSRLRSIAIVVASPTKNAIQPPRLYVK